MIKNLLYLFFALIVLAWGKFFSSDELRPELLGISIGFGVALLIDISLSLIKNRDFFALYWNCSFVKPNSPLRLSIAYIFKIESQGKYLLVKNTRFDNPTYQPVGGVYKYFYPEASANLRDLTIVTDNAIENDHLSEHDLRIKMHKRKNLKKFLHWFSKSENREVDPWREFYEELVMTNILPKAHFNYMYYKLIGQHFEPIHNDEFYAIDTFKYVDVYEPRFANQKQEQALKKLTANPNANYIWATEEEINRKRSNDGLRISDHSQKLFITQKLELC